MPLVTVDAPKGQLSPAQKADLAEELTQVMLEIEGGGDTPFGRTGSWVRFRELAREDWFVGGANDGRYVSASGPFLVEINVPEGLLDQPRMFQAQQATDRAFVRVLGVAERETHSVWVQIVEWPEGQLSSGGWTAGLFGIAKRAGHSADHPVLTFPRAYFAAKERSYDAHGFPEQTAGRPLDGY